MRKIEMWVECHELNDQGEYTPVEVIPKPEVPCAGVFQLRQVKDLKIKLMKGGGSNPFALFLKY